MVMRTRIINVMMIVVMINDVDEDFNNDGDGGCNHDNILE